MSDRPEPIERGEIEDLLARINAKEPGARERLFELIVGELRRLASGIMRAQSREITLQPTVLVNEAYCRMVNLKDPKFQNREHFFRVAAIAMRQIVVDAARSRKRVKRGDGVAPAQLADGDISIKAGMTDDQLIDLDDGLNELKVLNSDAAEVIQLRFFAGMSVRETATAMQLSDERVEELTKGGRTFLWRALRSADASERGRND